MSNHSIATVPGGITNSDPDRATPQNFITDLYTKAQNSAFLNSWNVQWRSDEQMTCAKYSFRGKRSSCTFTPELSWWRQDGDVMSVFTRTISNTRQLGKLFSSTWEWAMIHRGNTKKFYPNTSVGCIRSARTRSHCSYRSKFLPVIRNLNMAREIFLSQSLVRRMLSFKIKRSPPSWGESTEIVPCHR